MLTSYWAEVVVVAIVILLWAPRLSGPVDLRWDGGVYYILGTSMASGHGYRILSEPGSPEALQYPPLLPATIALLQRSLGSTDPAVVAPWLRKMNLVLFVVYAFIVLRLAQRYLPHGLAVAAVTLCLFQFMTIFVSDILSVDLPFALVGVVFVLIAASGWPSSRLLLRETISFVLAAAGFFLRTAGIALFISWVLEALVRRRWRLAIARSILAALPVLTWQLYVTRVQSSYEYQHPAYEYQRASYQFYNVSYAENIGLMTEGHIHPSALTAHLRSNLSPLVTGLGEGVSTSEYYWRHFLGDIQQSLTGRRGKHPVLTLVPILCLAGLVIAGLVILAIRRAWLMLFIPVVSSGLMWITPWPEQFLRYLMPVAPFLAIAALLPLSELRTLQRTRPGVVRAGRAVLAGFVLLALTLQIYTAWALFHQRWRNGANFARVNFTDGSKPMGNYFYYTSSWQAWEKVVAWIGKNTPPDAIIATLQRHLCYLRINRRAVLPPMETDPTRARRLLEAVPVSYVVIDETGEMAFFSRRYALPAVQGDPGGWRVVYSVDGTQVYGRAAGKN